VSYNYRNQKSLILSDAMESNFFHVSTGQTDFAFLPINQRVLESCRLVCNTSLTSHQHVSNFGDVTNI